MKNSSRQASERIAAWGIWLIAGFIASQASAQTPGQIQYEQQQREYWRQQEAQRLEQQRQQQIRDENARQQQKESADAAKRSQEQSRQFKEQFNQNMDSAYARQQEALRNSKAQGAQLEQARQNWLKKAPLAPDRNPLLGRWTRPAKSQANSSDPFAALAAMAKGGLCEMFFGDGVFEFRAGALVGIDRAGHQQELDQVEYRGDARQVAVIPKTTFKLMVFDFDGSDRINWQGQNCTMVRVNAGSGVATQSAAPRAQAAPANAAATPSPAKADASGSAVLSLAAGFGGSGEFQPITGGKFIVLHHSADAVLSKAGIRAARGDSIVRAWMLECHRGTPACRQGAEAMKGDGLGVLQTDAQGRAQTPPLTAGTYYVFGSVRRGDQDVLWNQRVELKPGMNTIMLDQRNAAPMK